MGLTASSGSHAADRSDLVKNQAAPEEKNKLPKHPISAQDGVDSQTIPFALRRFHCYCEDEGDGLGYADAGSVADAAGHGPTNDGDYIDDIRCRPCLITALLADVRPLPIVLVTGSTSDAVRLRRVFLRNRALSYHSCTSINQSINQSIYLSIYLSIDLSISLSVSRSIHLYVCLIQLLSCIASALRLDPT